MQVLSVSLFRPKFITTSLGVSCWMGSKRKCFLNARSDPFSQESAELLQERTDKDFLTTRSYRGSVFNIPTEGGSRTYRLERVERVGSWVNKAVASLGVILAVFGLTGFVYERKLARYQ